MSKMFKIDGSSIKQIIEPMGACIASDKITIDGEPIRYMYREKSTTNEGSGWNFFSGTETDDYVKNPDNLGIYEVNTIANYDQSIIPFLNSPFGTAWEKNDEGIFRQVQF